MILIPYFSRTSSPVFFFFNDTATTEIYTLSLHDALPICPAGWPAAAAARTRSSTKPGCWRPAACRHRSPGRSEEHTSELQSHLNLVCRLLLEKKKEPRHEPTVQSSRRSDQTGTLSPKHPA